MCSDDAFKVHIFAVTLNFELDVFLFIRKHPQTEWPSLVLWYLHLLFDEKR